MKKSLTKRDIAEAVASELGLSKRLSLALVDGLFMEMAKALRAGKTIKVVRFGIFRPVEKGPRPGTDPVTKRPITIPPRRTVSFTPTRFLKKEINGKGRRG